MFGELLQELRRDRGMTQRELGQLLSLTAYTISAYECGRSIPDDEIKIKIAEIFNISLDYLFGLIREPLSYNRNEQVIRIPSNFTEDDIKELQEFISFLKFKKQHQ